MKFAAMRPHRNWRRGLLGSAALGAVMLATSSPAWAACTTTGTILGCSGDVSEGVAVTAPYTSLTVQNLTASLSPAVDIDGISFLSNGSITINSNLGSYSILATGLGNGIEAKSYQGGAITIDNNGAVTSAAADAIYAESSGAITVINTGTVSGGTAGIALHGIDSGVAYLSQTGDVTATNGPAIAVDSNGAVTSISDGTINATGDGISAVSHVSGNATVDQTGDVTSTAGRGIYVWSQGTTSETSTGNISAYDNAIQAESHGSGDVLVSHTGDLTSTNADGVFAETSSNSSPGSTSVTVDGTIDAYVTGIHARSSNGSVSVTATGDITAETGYGVDATAPNGTVSVTTDGAITSANSGIYAISSAGTVTVQADGSINSSAGYGIDAETHGVSGSNGNVIVTGDADITAGVTGILALSTNGSLVSIDHSGSITANAGRGIDAQAPNGSVSVTNDGAISSTDTSIYARSSGGSVTVDQTGDVTSTEGYGVKAFVEGVSGSNGNVSVTVDGAVTASAAEDALTGVVGIYAGTTEGASATVVHSGGDINVTDGVGIEAVAPNGSVSVTNTSYIGSDGDAIYADSGSADSQAGTVSVSQYGDILAGGIGINAHASAGAVTVTSGTVDGIQSNIRSSGDGIYALADDNDATVTQYGNVQSDGGSGIVVLAPNGTAALTGAGNVIAHDDGIQVVSQGFGADTVVGWGGDVTAYYGTGIIAQSDNGAVQVTTNGTIEGALGGIAATSTGGSVTVNQTGSTWAWDGTAISATSANDDVTVNAGDVEGVNGINAASSGDGTVQVTTNGNVDARDGSGGYGIKASSATGAVSITANGTVIAQDDAIDASNTGGSDVSVTAYDDVTSNNGSAIVASSSTGAVTITSEGTIIGQQDGLSASNTGDGEVKILQSGGDVSAYSGTGITATSTTGKVTVQSSGNVTAQLDGIDASNLGDTDVSVTHDSGTVTAYSGTGIVASSIRGAVTVDNTGDIVAAAGDGIDASNESATNAVTVNQTGNITAKGDAINASSTNAVVNVTTAGGDISGGTNGIETSGYADLNVTVNSGSVSGGTGAAVRFNIGANNTLTNAGTIGSSTASLAVQSTDVDEIATTTEIDNSGTINGNIDLVDIANIFNNYSDGVFNAGSSVNIGTTGILTNDGTLSIGGLGTVATTDLTGSFVNSSDGTIALDVDMANATSDILNVSGTASLDGKLAVHLDSFSTGASSYQFLTSGEGITNETLAVANPILDAYVDYGTDTATLVIDGYSFAPAGVTGNAYTIGQYLNQSLANSTVLDDIAAGLASLTTVSDVDAALRELSPEVYMADQANANLAITGFSDNLLSCRVADGAYYFGAEGQCAWVRSDYKTVSHDSSSDSAGYDAHSWNFAGGTQLAAGNDVRVGFAIGGSTGSLNDDAGGHSTNDTLSLGAVVKYVPGPWLLAASLSGSYGWYDSNRSISFGGFDDDVSGKSKLGIVDARLRAAYTLQQGSFYAKPQVDADAVYSNQGAFTETGGLASIAVDSSNQTVFSVSPTLEIGGQTKLPNEMLLRPYLRGGVTVYSNDETKLTGTFAADDVTDAFTVAASTDQFLWKFATGLDVLSQQGGTLRVVYEGDFGSTTTSQTLGAKFSVNY